MYVAVCAVRNRTIHSWNSVFIWTKNLSLPRYNHWSPWSLQLYHGKDQQLTVIHKRRLACVDNKVIINACVSWSLHSTDYASVVTCSRCELMRISRRRRSASDTATDSTRAAENWLRINIKCPVGLWPAAESFPPLTGVVLWMTWSAPQRIKPSNTSTPHYAPDSSRSPSRVVKIAHTTA